MLSKKNTAISISSHAATLVESQSEVGSVAALASLHNQLHGLQTVLDLSDSYIFTKDTAGRYTYVNQKVQDLFCASYHDIIGKDDSCFFDLELSHELQSNDRQVIDLGETIAREERNFLKPSGEERIYWTIKKPVRDQQGQIIGMCGISTDITARKQTDNKLISLQTRLEFLLKSTPAVIYSARAYGDFGATFISDNVTAQLGYQPGKFTEDTSFWLNHIHPDDRIKVCEEMGHLLETGNHKWVYRFQHHDGSFRWMRDEAVLIRDNDGQPHEIAGYWIDITAQKIAEDQQGENAKQLKRILDTLFCYVALLDTNGIIQEVNEAPLKQSGVRREDVIGTCFSDGPWWSYDDAVRSRLLAAIEVAKQGQTIRYDEVVKMGEGLVAVDMQVSPVLDSSGNIIGILPTGVDITERKQLEASLRLQQFGLENASDEIFWITRDARIVEVNKKACLTLGYTSEEIKQLSVADIDPHFPIEKWPEHWLALKRNKSLRFETLHKCRNGRIFPVEVVANYFEYEGVEYNCAFARDISVRQQTEQLLRIAATAFESKAGIMLIDVSHKVIQVNQIFTNITGYSAEEVLGKEPFGFYAHHDDPAFYQFVWTSVVRDGSWQDEIWYKKKSGQAFPIWLDINTLTDENGCITHFVGLLMDITLRNQAEKLLLEAQEKLETQLRVATEEIFKYEEEVKTLRIHAEIDPLTKLANRKLLFDQLENALALAKRFNDNVALLFLDLDGFKQVNDHFGHGQGDDLLIEVAKRLRHSVREVDTVARLGGDEFVIILNRTSKSMVTDTARRILDALVFDINQNGFTVTISASIGIAIYPDDSMDPLLLLKYADEAMYKAKEKGKHQFCWHLNPVE